VWLSRWNASNLSMGANASSKGTSADPFAASCSRHVANHWAQFQPRAAALSQPPYALCITGSSTSRSASRRSARTRRGARSRFKPGSDQVDGTRRECDVQGGSNGWAFRKLPSGRVRPS
jgi:hypothetical protein